MVGVHNGIIENYEELKQKLLNNGYRFYSGTDTEVVIKLVDYYYKKYKIGPIDAINRMMVRVRGSYALALMFKDYPGELYCARKDSPLIIGVGEGESFLASDVPAILKHTRDVYYIDNLQSARLLPGEAHFFDLKLTAGIGLAETGFRFFSRHTAVINPVYSCIRQKTAHPLLVIIRIVKRSTCKQSNQQDQRNVAPDIAPFFSSASLLFSQCSLLPVCVRDSPVTYAALRPRKANVLPFRRLSQRT